MSDLPTDPAARRILQMLRAQSRRGAPHPSALVLVQKMAVENRQVYGEVLKALRFFVSHTLVLGQEWPCSYCGRDKHEPLQKLEIRREDGSVSYEGCWYCNMRPVLEQACTALALF